MSSSYSVTIGPYVQIMGNHTVTKVKTKKECSTEGHNKKQQGNFCCDCGKELIDVEYDEVTKVRPRHILYNLDGHEDDLWSPEGFDSILMPNQYPPNNIKLKSGYDGGGVEDLTIVNLNELKQEQITWFHEKYSVCLSTLYEAYGLENVLVKWGTIGYWS